MADPAHAGPRLAATGLTLRYDRRTVVDGLSLTVPDGALTAIIGPNGCGRSTLLRALARVHAPAEGACTSTAPTSRRTAPASGRSGSRCCRSR